MHTLTFMIFETNISNLHVTQLHSVITHNHICTQRKRNQDEMKIDCNWVEYKYWM